MPLFKENFENTTHGSYLLTIEGSENDVLVIY